ncbi:hypothetical protein WISP_06041 [Willisornis vidua]|uniref:Rna-directed dna polymerase from mobile element jockey-like n=1 Tax=Willisornis vidua TaxID=1566151 RepID=A0ABQ9DSU5_9PASS|nr:hypothetical protein WISP_06041 [Willisornis vidua]
MSQTGAVQGGKDIQGQTNPWSALRRFTDDTELGGGDLLEGGKALQGDVDWLDRWVSRVRFNRAKSQVLPLGHNNPMGCSRIGKEGLESWKRTWGCWLTVDEQVNKKANVTWLGPQCGHQDQGKDHPPVLGTAGATPQILGEVLGPS